MLNKSLIGISFAESPDLNIVFQDLMEDGVSWKLGDETFNESAGMVETILSPNFFTRGSVTLHLVPTSPKNLIWAQRVLNNGAITGSATITLDNGENVTIRKMRISREEYTADGKPSSSSYTIHCDVRVNKDLVV